MRLGVVGVVSAGVQDCARDDGVEPQKCEREVVWWGMTS